MKKLISLLLIATLAVAVLAGCGKKDEALKLGLLAMTNTTEEEVNQGLAIINKDGKISENGVKVVIFDNLSSMVMALENDDVDKIRVPYSVASYIINQNDNLEIEDEEEISNMAINGYSFLFPAEKEELRDRFDAVITELKSSGELVELIRKYLADATYVYLEEAVEMPSFDGAETITVAITGDMPPMDFVDEAGNPAGFNTALLAVIAEKLEINIKFISIDSASRAIALKTGKADISFWSSAEPDPNVIQKNNLQEYDSRVSSRIVEHDTPEGTIITQPYYTVPKVTVKKMTTRGEP